MEMFIFQLVFVSVLVSDSRGCQFYPDKVYNGTFADCTRRNLSTIPTDLPANMTVLDLSNNVIRVLSLPSNVTFRGLKCLNISHNRLKNMSRGVFKQFFDLQELYLHNNNLLLDNNTYPEDIFQPLQNLLKLHLHNNDMPDEGSYPEDAIGNLGSIEELKIDTFAETYFGWGFSKLLSLKRLLLGFMGCKLANIQNITFENLRNVSLILIDLDHCPVTKVETGSFLPLKSLKYFHLSNSRYLKPTTALLSMYGFKGRNLSSISMNRIFAVLNFRNVKVKERTLSNELLVHLEGVCVKNFTMIHNQLIWFGNRALNNTVFGQCIKHLDLSMNDFYGDSTVAFTLANLPNIVYFNISTHTRIYTDSKIPRRHNYFPNIGFTLPSSLQVMNVDGLTTSPIYLYKKVTFYNATSLEYLSLAHNGANEFRNRVIGLENLKFVDLSGNNCSGMNPTFFDDFPNLDSLCLKDVKFGERNLLEYGRRLFSPMKKLRKINLFNNNIRLLDPNIFISSHIEEIVLSRNRFESVPFGLKTTPNLRHLDIGFNSLTVLSNIEMNLMDDLASRNNLTLNLEGNLLSCGCDNLGFIMWLYNTNVRLVHVSTYVCQMNDGTIANTSYIRDNYEEIWMTCNGRMAFTITIVCLAVFIVVTFVIYLTIRRKTLIVNILLRMFGYGPLPPGLIRENFFNDAYIGYSEADYQYICHTVRDHLENKHDLKLFIRDRDTIPGGQIADDIINGIDSSWRTILFLTAAFLNDQWCQFTINRAVYSSSRMTPGSVILILSDDVMRGDIDPALLNMVEESNIFFAVKYKDDDDRLWKEVSEIIKQINMA